MVAAFSAGRAREPSIVLTKPVCTLSDPVYPKKSLYYLDETLSLCWRKGLERGEMYLKVQRFERYPIPKQQQRTWTYRALAREVTRLECRRR